MRKLLHAHNLSANDIAATGKSGRLTTQDVQNHLANAKQATTGNHAATPAAVEAPQGDRYQERVPMTRLRQRIAERLLDAQSQAAILTTFNEVDMQAVIDLRTRYKSAFQNKHDTKLGFMSRRHLSPLCSNSQK